MVWCGVVLPRCCRGVIKNEALHSVPGAVSDANEVRSRARTLEQQAKRLEPKLAAAASKGQKLAVTAAAAQNPEGLPPKLRDP